jgi:hypothetical protein
VSSEDDLGKDVPPHLNGGKTLEERVGALEDIAEGPPRLPDRLIELEQKVTWLVSVVESNKLSAGVAGDEPHRIVVRDEAGELVTKAEARQDIVNQSVFARIAELFGITGGLQQASLRLFGILALGGAVIIYILARALGA